MKRIFSLLIITLLSIGITNAQFIISGTVKDSLQKPINGASVTLHKKSSSLISAYAITNAAGNFQIKYNTSLPVDSFYVKANAMGFAFETKNINVNTEFIAFTLKVSAFTLPNVTVKNLKPFLRYKSDTLSYAVDSFMQKQDRTIGDVLKKMPGIEVDGNGKISYNGKAISNFYIDGDNLLDDKYNIATNSIGADMVKDVQVLENHQPIKMLRDKTNSDKIAINLNMKDKAKVKLMGRSEMGLGFSNEILYDESINLMAFKKKYKAINSIKLNNTGKNIGLDVLSHNLADFLKMQENNVPQDLLGINDAGNPPIGESRYLFNKSNLVNLNNLVNLKKDLQLKANVSYLYDDVSKDYSSNTYYYLPTDTISYLQKQNSVAKSNTVNVNCNLNSNAAKHYLNNSFVFEFNNTPINAATTLNTVTTRQLLQQQNTKFSNDFSLLKILKSNKTLQYYSYIAYLNKPEILEILPGINSGIFNNGIDYYSLKQKVNIPGFYTNNSIALGFTTKKINQLYKLGFTSQHQLLSSNLFVTQSDLSTKILTDSFANHLNYNNNTLKVTAKWEYMSDRLKASFTFPIDWVNIKQNDEQKKQNKFPSFYGIILKPSLYLKYAVGKENYLQSTFGYGNDVADVEQLYNGKILRNYQQLYYNNFTFSAQNNLRANISFNYRKTIKILFASIGLAYSRVNSNSSTNRILQNDMQITSLVGLANSMENISANAGISKYIFKIHSTVSLKINASQSDWVKVQNNLLLHYLNNSYSANFSITPKINKWLTAAYSSNFSLAESKNEIMKSNSQKTFQVKNSLELNYMPTDNLFFTFNADDYYVKQYSNNQKYHYFFGDASCMYKFNKKKIDVKLLIQNVANVKEFKTLNLFGNMLTENINTIRPRAYMLKVYFNF